jgi:hypothetical protein
MVRTGELAVVCMVNVSKYDKHGALMYAFFFLLLQVFGHDGYLQTALQCGDVVWKRGLLTKGYSICHGVAGNAYTFLVLYQLTEVSPWVFKFVLPCTIYIYYVTVKMGIILLVSTGSQTSSPSL